MTKVLDFANLNAVREVARLVAASLKTGIFPELTPELIRFAEIRHRVRPCLHDMSAGDDFANKQRATTIHAAALTQHISKLLTTDGIPHLVLKGTPLASALYPSIFQRHHGDIDVLVTRSDFPAATRTLVQNKFLAESPSLGPDSFLSKGAFHLLRELSFTSAHNGVKLELHQRLFFGRSLSEDALAFHAELAPKKVTTDIAPSPDLGAGLAHYLICHGGISGWTRLKWLVDLWLLIPKLSDDHISALIAACENVGTQYTAKASLHLLCAVFPGELPTMLAEWIGQPGSDARVIRRLRYYSQFLGSGPAMPACPLNSRYHALRAAMLLRPRAKDWIDLAQHAPTASGLRILAAALDRMKR